MNMPAERMPGTPSLPRPWRGNLALALVSLALGWGLLEAAAGRIMDRPAPRWSPPLLGGDFPMNSQRFRDFEYPQAKGPGVFRILVAGDSFTFGKGVAFDDSYPKRLERALNYFGDPGRTVYQVLNAGVSQRSTPEELELARSRAEIFNPDLIILGYCLNDAEDWQDPGGIQALRARYHQHLFTPPEGFWGLFYRHSAVTRLVVRRLFNTRAPARQIAYYRSLYREGYSGWRRTRDALKDLGAFARERGIPAVGLIFPLFSFGLGDDYPLAAVHQQVQRAMGDAGLPLLDLREAYRDLSRLRLEAIPYADPHPSEIGHRIAAEALLSFLLENRLLPGGRSVKSLARGPARATPFAPPDRSGAP
jgi:hypothetical protein